MNDEEYIKNISSISTEDLFNSLEYYGYDSYYAVLWQATIEELKKRIEIRPHGKWIKEDDEHLKGWYRCSECGRRVEDLTDDIKIHAGGEDYTIADLYPYCHCGAKMEGGEDE